MSHHRQQITDEERVMKLICMTDVQQLTPRTYTPYTQRNKAAQQAEAPAEEEDEEDAELQARLEAIRT
eukprot:scaffold295276_cov18-Tisochrysis_lutea.AAC.1